MRHGNETHGRFTGDLGEAIEEARGALTEINEAETWVTNREVMEWDAQWVMTQIEWNYGPKRSGGIGEFLKDHDWLADPRMSVA